MKFAHPENFGFVRQDHGWTRGGYAVHDAYPEGFYFAFWVGAVYHCSDVYSTPDAAMKAARRHEADPSSVTVSRH